MDIKRLVFLIFIIILTCCSNSLNKKKIATFDSGVVLIKDVIDEYDKLSDTKKSEYKTEDDFFRLIRKIALEKIILNEAYSEGLNDDDKIKEKILKSEKDIAFNFYKNKNVTDKINITKKDYQPYKKRYELYQIVKRTDILDQSKVKQNKDLLIKLSKSIKSLDDFKENAEKYSDDYTASNGGYVGLIRLGIMEEVIDDEIRKLKTGEVSNIVESSSGFHLLYINKIEDIPDKELYNDKKLYDEIYNNKKKNIEESWYQELLKNKALTIKEDLFDKKVYDDEIIIQYKDKSITRKEFFTTVDKYKQGVFPEPTAEDLLKLAKNMGLSLIIEKESMNSNIIKSREYKNKLDENKKFIIMNEYINRNLVIPDITDQAIQTFYNENIKSLFTFKDRNGKLYQQPINEVKKFISQKLKRQNIQEARYELYRKLVADQNLNINKKLIEELIKSVK